MSRGSVRSSIASLLCLAALLPAPLAASSDAKPNNPAKAGTAAPKASEPETFFESVDVQVVNVDVYVADKSGKRVPGLKREDFELYEDGKPITISNFYAVDGEAAPAAADTPPAAGTPVNAITPAPPTEQRLYLTLFIDQRSLTAPARNRLIPALKSFVAGRLRPGDRLLLASYNGTVQVQGPTGDPAVVNAALDALMKTAPRGTESALERRHLLSEIEQAVSVDDPNRPPIALENARETYGAIRLFAQTQYDQVRTTLGALNQFVDSLAGLPGRKAVVMVSGGLSQRPAEEIFQLWQNKFVRFAGQVGVSNFESFRNDTTRLFEDVIEHANASRATFYTLAAPEDFSGRSAEYAGDPNWSQDLAATAAINQTQPLQSLAAGTGGLAAIDTPKSLLDRLRGDLDAYYSLGYVPDHRKDGQKHKLTVKLHDRNLVVRSRESYRERTGLETTANRTLSALLLGEEVNPFEVSFAVEGESRDKKGQYQVTLLVKLPMAKLVLLPHGDAHEGRLRIFVGARDNEGRVSPINEIAVPIRVPNNQILTVMSQNAATRITLLLRPGEHRLAIGVRDELGNTDSTVTSNYTAGSMTVGAAPKPGLK
ncbi:MAG TPA: VWA domain-containing protein [Thermoanaerobaculia bacterium]|jgi:VWFA-related protein|nr:VWA domain-containing protein [Thermoanaerobaculia bacterium]